MQKFLILLCLMIIGTSSLIGQENRIALIIGNATYKQGVSAPNSKNDALDMNNTLQELGFQTTTLIDATRSDIERAVQKFGDKIKTPNTVALFYYSGHGAQLFKKNYLITTDTEMEYDEDMKFDSFDLDGLFNVIRDAKPKMSLIFLDSTRENSFKSLQFANYKGFIDFPSVPAETAIVSAGQIGTRVPDSVDKRNNMLTRAFLQQLAVSNQDISVVLKRTNAQVQNETGGRQKPFVFSNILGDFTFNAKTAAVTPSPSQKPKLPLGTKNLVVNPNASLQPVTKNGWTQLSGDWTTLVKGKDTKPEEVFFWPGNSAKGELFQDINLSPYGEQIAKGGMNFLFTIQLNSFDKDTDNCAVKLEFYDVFGNLSGSSEIPETNVDVWTEFKLQGTLSNNWALVRIKLIGTRQKGNNNDAYFRAVSFTLPNYDNDPSSSGQTGNSTPAKVDLVKLPEVNDDFSKEMAKSVPANRTKEIKTDYGFGSAQGEISNLDIGFKNLLADAYSYQAVKGENFRFEFNPEPNSKMQNLIVLRSPSGKVQPYYGESGRIEAETTFAESGAYTILVATGQNWPLAKYSLLIFGRGIEQAGELEFNDPYNDEDFGNRQDTLDLKTVASAFYRIEISSDDKQFKPRIAVVGPDGKKLDMQKKEGDNYSSYDFLVMSDKIKVFIRNAGMFPFSKYKIKITLTGIGK